MLKIVAYFICKQPHLHHAHLFCAVRRGYRPAGKHIIQSAHKKNGHISATVLIRIFVCNWFSACEPTHLLTTRATLLPVRRARSVRQRPDHLAPVFA